MSEQEHDPAVRCDSCQKILMADELVKVGCCPHCGNRRIRSITVCNEDELQQLLDWGFKDMVTEYQEANYHAQLMEAEADKLAKLNVERYTYDEDLQDYVEVDDD